MQNFDLLEKKANVDIEIVLIYLEIFCWDWGLFIPVLVIETGKAKALYHKHSRACQLYP